MGQQTTYYLLLLFLVISGCAQQGAPTGGPKDEVPPKVVQSTPKNYSTNFTGNKISITFDEFLDMGNFTQELVVSPPMEEKPVIKLRNKTLIIEFEADLKENTTYTFNFGEGIKDLNEKNVLLNYEYVFSTGDYLDSLSIKGTLKKAFDLSIPEIPVFVMLYNEYQDSLPLKEIPYYVGRTDKNGNYAVNNLRPDIYKLFVLKDGNNNFLFDQPTEEIAFLDSTIHVDADYFKSILMESGKYDSSSFQPDTAALDIDTTGWSQDSIKILLDSLDRAKPDLESIFVDLFMFTEDPENQFLSDNKRETRERADLVFNLPLTRQFSYRPILPDTLERTDFLEVFSQKRDSLTLWMKDTLIASLDTISIEAKYLVKDSTGTNVFRADTISLNYRDRAKSKKGQKEEPKHPPLTLKTVRSGDFQDINRNLFLTTEHPLASIDTAYLDMFIIPDSIEFPVVPVVSMDSSRVNRARLQIKWEPETKYRMVLYPGAVRDIYEKINDTLDVTFTTKKPEDYGVVHLALTGVEDDVIVQLYVKNLLKEEITARDTGIYTFSFLKPATYRIKFIYDRNHNGKWDTGKYLKMIQPEKVEYLPADIAVRANWEHEAAYTMGSNTKSPAVEEKKSTEKSKSGKSNKTNSNSTRQNGGNQNSPPGGGERRGNPRPLD